MQKLNQIITAILCGRVSIVIYIAMFVYLVPVALLGLLPGLEWMEPSTNAMLIGDNYTSVLAALAASLAAGAGIAIHQKAKEHKQGIDELKRLVEELHAKLDAAEKR
ncbi:MAG: hypothetical protein LBI84_01860 [Propionibacteriaceae bacterium]|jgi:hypothetical protein|nr:hypothetical protein [Propionibacteriaceae bacterium]